MTVVQELVLTKAKPEHKGFIISTWMRSLPKTKFKDKHEATVAENRWRDCWVATDEDGYTVYAWVCGKEGSLYHCYVIPELRRLRVATRLIEHACGKLTEYARTWPYAQHAPINPYLLGMGL